jgi:hypothetical protein
MIPQKLYYVSNIYDYHLCIYKKKLDLYRIMHYSFSEQEAGILSNLIQKGLPIMKLAIRAFAICVVLAGAAAATLTSGSRQVASHQSASAHFPIPICGPGIPCAVDNAASAKH